MQINDHSILASRASISSSQKWIEDLWSQRRYSEQTQQSANSIEQKRCTSETVSESESLNLLELLIDLNESPTNEKSLSPTSSSDNLDTESIKRITDQVELMEETNSINSIIDLASKEVLIASNVVEETKGKSIGKVIVEDSNLSNAQTVLNTLVKPSFKDEDFIIPTLPKGQHLRVRVISNWGDEKFVGLNGIEIFDANTMKLANIEKVKRNQTNLSK